jgi:MFS family permease
MLAVLRRRSFALLWFSGLLSMAGDWALYAALPYFVFQRTGSTLATAGMIVAELAPSALLSTFAGVLVDRWPRRRLLIADHLGQAVAVSSLILLPHNGLWLIYVVAASQSLLSSFAAPAKGALIPAVVPDGELVQANALSALANRLSRIAGAPIGGALLAASGLSAVVIADVATFVAAAALTALIRTPVTSAPIASPSMLHDLRDGLRLVARDRQIAVLFAVLGLMTFGGTMLDPLDVAWVRQILGAGPDVYALLLTTHAVVGVAGSLLVGNLGRRTDPRHLIGWTSLIAGLSCAVQYNLGLFGVSFAMTAVRGASSVISGVGVDTLVQRGVPDRFRGRVLGALGASSSLLSLLGASVGGVVAHIVGIVPALNISAALIIAAGVVVLLPRVLPRRKPEKRLTKACMSTEDRGNSLSI